MSTEATGAEPQSVRRLGFAGVAALGVVFGDIGTSPLYTLKTVLNYTGPHPDRAATLGALSLIVWTLFLITTVKYVNIAMRIDNDGEGGIIALMTLLGVKRHQRPLIVAAGLFGAALIYGDGAITPAISVLSAIEGVEQIAPSLQSYVLPAASAILLALFAIQPFGTAAIGRAFGPIMLTVVHHHSGAGRARNYPASFRRRGDQSALWRKLPHERRLQGVSRAGRRVSMRHRGRGALRRHGPFRAEADPLLVDSHRLPGAYSQLRRAGRDRARRRADRWQHLLSAVPSSRFSRR